MITTLKKITIILFILFISLTISACKDRNDPNGPSIHTLTFETFGGTRMEPRTFVAGGSIVVEEVPSKDGHEFSGWYTNPNFTISFPFSKMPNNDVVAYARWNPLLYSISVYSERTNAYTSVTPHSMHFYGTTVTIHAAALDNHEFSHWYNHTDDSIFTDEASFSFKVQKDLLLEAVYNQDPGYSIHATANIEGATIDFSNPGPYYLYNPITLTALNVEGFEFVHWYDHDYHKIATRGTNYSFNVLREYNLEAIYLPENQKGLFLFSNLESAIVTSSTKSPHYLNDTVSVSASEVSGYIFSHWYNYAYDVVVSLDTTYTFQITKHTYLIAVYEKITGHSMFHQTGFEDVSKTSYAEGIITSGGLTWLLNESLIGTLANDVKVGNRAVRMRVGYMQTYESIQSLEKIEFLYASYTGDSSTTLLVQLSRNGVEWVTLDTLMTSTNQQTYEKELDMSILNELGLTKQDSLFLRIENITSNRANIDDIKLYSRTTEQIDHPQIELHRIDPNFPDASNRLQITFQEGYTGYYSYGESWSSNVCVAIDIEFGELPCSILGDFSTYRLGKQTITYYAIDIEGNIASYEYTKTVFRDKTKLDETLSPYYKTVEGLYGEELMEALRLIVNANITMKTYGQSRYILNITDRDPNNASNLIVVYLGRSVSGQWDLGVTWNREHVWPQSLLNVDTNNDSLHVGADLHNLKPSNPNENSSRGNKYFDFSTTSASYAPREEVRGDIARILFYMVVMYDYLSLVNTHPSVYEMGKFNTLMTWMFEDEVDNFERNRNNVIYSYQGNRNPFIDYPHFAELIWFDHSSIPLP